MLLLQLLMLLLAVAAAIVPMVLYLLLMWWLDRYEREPLWAVGLTFGWGAVGGALLAILFSLVLDTSLGVVLDDAARQAAGPVFIAPLVEELTKGCVLLLLLRHRLFDNATDGFVYGTATGLGFAMTENFMYFAMVAVGGHPEEFVGVVFLRTLFSAPLHGMASGSLGAALGLSKYQRQWLAKPLLLLLGLAAAMGLHMFWNAMAVTGELTGRVEPVAAGFLGLPLYFLVFFGSFQLSMLHERWIIGRELDEEAADGLIPRHYVPILQSWFRRQGRGWLPRGVPHHHFVTICTRLAFRKHQALRVRRGRRFDYTEEIRILRQEIRTLLRRGAHAVGQAPRDASG